MKKNFIKFIAQIALVGVLSAIGIVALTGEPTDDANFIKIFAIQMIVAVICLGSAIVLGRKWQINRKLTATGLFQ